MFKMATNSIWRRKGKQKRVQLTAKERKQLLYWGLFSLLLMLGIVYANTLQGVGAPYTSIKANAR
jgi:hypothetical protein